MYFYLIYLGPPVYKSPPLTPVFKSPPGGLAGGDLNTGGPKHGGGLVWRVIRWPLGPPGAVRVEKWGAKSPSGPELPPYDSRGRGLLGLHCATPVFKPPLCLGPPPPCLSPPRPKIASRGGT